MRHAFEFRELSWMSPQVGSILKKFNAAFCIDGLAGHHSALNVTTDFAGVRLHGPEIGKYQGSYSEERLRAWAHDQAGYAAANALTLKRLVFGTRMQKVA